MKQTMTTIHGGAAQVKGTFSSYNLIKENSGHQNGAVLGTGGLGAGCKYTQQKIIGPAGEEKNNGRPLTRLAVGLSHPWQCEERGQ